MAREFVVRVGVNYDDKERKVFPFGLKWVEIDGKRIDNGLQRVVNQHSHNEFGTTTIEVAGYRYEEVDARDEPEERGESWKTSFIKLVKAMSPDTTVALDPADWTVAEWELITEHAK